MIIGILSSMLSGASFGAELGSLERGARPGQDGHFLAVIRIISTCEDVTRFKTRMDHLLRQVHACRRAPGVDRIYLPGAIEVLTEQAYPRDGIPLQAVALADLRRVCVELDVTPASYARLT
ncbi:MAG: hypothetical protein C4289_08115 [Chloroflexota bacterium]